ncbi:cyanophycinase [Laspinema palackyanum]|uniref:Cyanophycinase n=1 Tax=Laspinema palackyanum D2a TaxID=2953684 RepID=A0ABT2MPZ5_9CYAN|nr:cyanophycinase [Laspinema sp. D2c]MCT7963687.1 cyanophycinase [Laspinema sp. D2b]MCT7966803.1 cyanophycinase [Laspinema sp. D2a]
MLQLDTQSLQQKMPQTLKSTVMVIGGAEDKVHGREILHTFFTRAGGSEAKIAIVPCASREPSAIGDRYNKIFTEMGATSIELLDIRERTQGEDPKWQEYMEECTGVFMTGGDQLRLCALVADTPLMEKVRMKVREGKIVLAGTSAGAAVMGHHMIAGGGSGESPNRSLVDMATGLGILPDVIVDQHFHNRNRMARLLSAIASHPDRLGIGIDEDTCAMFQGDGVIEVIGKGTVTIVDPGSTFATNEQQVGATDPLSLYNMRLHILCHGDRFELRQRISRPTHP